MIYCIHVNTFLFLVYYVHVLLINFELSYSRRGRPYSSRERNRYVRNTLSSQAKVGPSINVGDRQEERGRARSKERGWIGGGGREERLLDGSRSASRGRGRGGVSRERGGGGRERKRGSLSRESERGGGGSRGGSIERGSSVNIRAGSFDLQDDRDTVKDHDENQGSISITRNRNSNRERDRGVYRATSSERGSSRGSAVRPYGRNGTARNGNGLGEHLHGISRPKVRVSDSMSTVGTNNNNNNNGDYDNISNYNRNNGSGERNRDSHRGEMLPELSYFIQPAIRSHFSDSKKEGSSIKKSHSGGSVSALSWKSSGQRSVQNSRVQDPVYGEKELEKLRDCLSNHPQLKKEKEREAVRSDKEKDKLRHKGGGATRYTDIQKINSKIQSKKSNDEFDITKDLESVGLGPSPVPPPSDRVVDVYARGTGTYFKNLFARSQSPSLTRGRGVGVGTGVGVVRGGERERERERSASPMSSQNVCNMSSNQMRENVRRLADAQRACVVSPPAARNERRHYD